MRNHARILIVEDEMILAMDLQDRLERLGHEVLATIPRGEDAYEEVGTLEPDLIFMDVRLQGKWDGIETAKQIRQSYDYPIIFLTAFSDDPTVLRATESDPFGYLHKPCEDRELRTAVEIALNKHRKERQLREREACHYSAMNSLGDAVIIVTVNGRISMLNREAEKLLNVPIEAAADQPIHRVFNVIDALGKAIQLDWHTVLTQQQPFTIPMGWRLQRTNETTVAIEGELAPIRGEQHNQSLGVIVVLKNADARQEMEERLRYTQKLESLGVLAGGVAHDFNNLLTPILGYTSLALGMLPEQSPISPMLSQIEHAARQAAELTQQILAYSGKSRTILEVIELGKLVRDMGALLSVGIPKQIRLQYELSAEPLPVRADATQLRQVLMNLITNAHEAIAKQEGVIHLRTYRRTFATDVIRDPYSPRELPPGDYVCFEVEDTGSGIAAENLQRIFDPFFSTKFTGRGLGLSAVQGIVRSHEGVLLVRSTVGVGTLFQVVLPLALTAPEIAPSKHPTPVRTKTEGTVLLIEDDMGVRNLVQLILQRLGFEVVGGENAQEASVYLQQGIIPRIALVDLHTPGTPMTEWVREIRQAGAQFPVILMSGNANEVMMDQFKSYGFSGFLQKPFTFDELRQSIQTILATHSPA